MEDKKTMGSALLDVFDAGVVLVKSEVNAVGKKVGEVAKAKGIGVLLILGAVGPLLMGLIFLILCLYFAIIRFFGWHPWAAALTIALISFAITAALAVMGIKKLGAEVDTDQPRHPVEMSELSHPTAAAAPAAAGTAETVYLKDVVVQPVPQVQTSTSTYASTPASGESYVTVENRRVHDDGIQVSTTPTFREDMQQRETN